MLLREHMGEPTMELGKMKAISALDHGDKTPWKGMESGQRRSRGKFFEEFGHEG